MLNDALADSELAYFHSLAPNTEFEINTSGGPYYNPRTVPISGNKSIKGPAKVIIPAWAFKSKELLFTILGHELIHASHYESGSYARWYAEYGFDSQNKLYAHFLSEAYAYKWSAPYVETYGLEDTIGGYESYNKNLQRIPVNYNFPK